MRRGLLPGAAVAWLALGASAAVASVEVPPLSLTAGKPFDGAVAAVVSRCDLGALAPVVTWGDGATTAGQAVATGQSTYEVRSAHTYQQAGDYTLGVTVKECSTGGLESARRSVHVAEAPSQGGGEVASPAPPPPLSPPPPAPPAHGFAVAGAGRHHAPLVRVYDAITGGLRRSFLAFSPRFGGGVRVAAADVDGDRVADIVAGPGPGTRARVKVFSGADGRLLRRVAPFGRAFRKGVYVAAGDVDGDGRAEVIVGAGAGAAPQVKVLDGADGHLRSSFLAYAPTFDGGVRVAGGDVDGDGHADVVAGTGPGVGGHVKVFSGAGGSTLMSFFAYGPAFTGGVHVGAGDVDGDGRADVVAGGGPQVKVFSGASGATLMSFLPFGPTGAVRVAAADADGDGRADVLATGGPLIKAFSGADGSTLAGFLAGSPTGKGTFVAGGR